MKKGIGLGIDDFKEINKRRLLLILIKQIG